MAQKISGPQYYCSVMRRLCVELGEEPEEIFTQGGTKRSVARLNKKSGGFTAALKENSRNPA
jgi:hypothetical protein